MDNRKLSILKSDQCKKLVLTIPGIGGEVIAHYGPVTDSPKEMAEVVRRYNAYPELVEVVRGLLEDGIGTAYDSKDDEIGYRTCCMVTSYKPHAPSCPAAKAIALLKTLDQ